MKIFKSLVALFMLTLVLASCNDDNTDTTGVVITDPTTEEVRVNPLMSRSSTSSGGLDLDCVTITYPFDIVDDQGVIYTITQESDFEQVLDDAVIVDFVYPLGAVVDDVVVDFADIEELTNAFASCLPAGGWSADLFPAYDISNENSCYTLQYPLTLDDGNGNTVVVDDAADLNAAVATAPMFFTFPLNLVDTDGSVVTAADVDGLFSALFSCNGWEPIDSLDINWQTGFEYIDCYRVDFPLSILLADGSTVTVNDHMELCDYMLRGEMVDYAYPMTLIADDGTEIVVNSEQEIYDALEDCDGFVSEDPSLTILWLGTQPFFDNSLSCWTVDFPITIVEVATGITSTIAAQADLDLAVSAQAYDLVFPAAITYLDGTGLQLQVEADLMAALEACR